MYSNTHPNIHKIRVCRIFYPVDCFTFSRCFGLHFLKTATLGNLNTRTLNWQPNSLHRQMFAGTYSTGQTINYMGTLIILKARDYWHYYSTEIPKFWLRKKKTKSPGLHDRPISNFFLFFLALKFWQKFRMFQFVKTTWWFALSHQRPTWNVFYHTRGQNSYDFSRFGIFVEFSNSGWTKLNCAFDVDVLSAGFSSRSCCFQKTQILVPQ